jgi:LysM repeat protein
MAQKNRSAFRLTFVCTSLTVLSLLVPTLTPDSVYALTASIGQPYRGHLVNGVPFPRQFRGYYVRDENHSYGTPELIGAVLDAVEKVHVKYPDAADLFIGDVSGPQGGRLRHHRSHENGRDIDLGMYAKDNAQIKGFVCMTEDNLDVAKTWELVDNLLRSRRIQYIFLDNSIQRLLYNYALNQGNNQAYLDRLFGVAGNQNARTVIQHMRGHRDHIHVRFYAPWSTLAGQLASLSEKQRDIIELAQGAYLPKKVNYYVQGGESGLTDLAASFGVTTRDLCRWNQLRGNEILSPGSCLVFYKRGFEVEPVRLAQSLQPNTGVELPVAVAAQRSSSTPVQLAALQEELGEAVTDVEDRPARLSMVDRRTAPKPKVSSHAVRKGDTLAAIAKQNKTDIDTLCRLNGLKKNTKLSLGQKLKVPGKDAGSSRDRGKAVASKGPASKHVMAKSDPKKHSSKPADKNSKVAASHKSKQTPAAAKGAVGKQQTVAKGKHSPVTTAKSGAGKQQVTAKGKGTQPTSSKNAKTDKKVVADTKTAANKKADKPKDKAQSASAKAATVNSKKNVQPAKKDAGKLSSKTAVVDKPGKKTASSNAVAANHPPKGKKPM